MPNYTLCLLLRVGLTEEDREKFLQELGKTLSNSTKAEIVSWGKRDLAYPVKKETQAFYYLLNFEADGTMPAALDKKLKLAEQVLRFLIVRRLGKIEKAREVRPSLQAKVAKLKKTKVKKAVKKVKTKAKKKTVKKSKKSGR